MTATFVNFTPNTTAPFSFQCTLNGSQYTVTVTWNIYGQRYYITVSDLSGNVVLYRPLISCGPQFQSQLSWSEGDAEVVTSSPHNVPLGWVCAIYVSQTDTGFDGLYEALSTGPSTLIYPLATDPATATPLTGQVDFNLNMVQDVVDDSYLLFRYQTQQFEYGP
jgi:hypothetical protein